MSIESGPLKPTPRPSDPGTTPMTSKRIAGDIGFVAGSILVQPFAMISAAVRAVVDKVKYIHSQLKLSELEKEQKALLSEKIKFENTMKETVIQGNPEFAFTEAELAESLDLALKTCD